MKPKLICFDLDGTIIDETIFIWQTIHENLGTSREKRQWAVNAYHNKEITYEEWAKHDIELWKEVGATKKEVLEAITPLKLMQGAEETLKELKKRGFKLAVISGSLNIALEQVLPHYKEYFDYVFVNKVFFDKEGKIKNLEATPFDFEHKASALKLIAEKEKIKLDECVFVGDHQNDLQIAGIAGLSIAFNCKSDELAQISDIVTKTKDLREILEHIK